MTVLTQFIDSYIDLFIEMAPWLLMGFIIAGIIHITLPLGKMKAFLGKPGFFSSLKAALFGVPLPLCSCGVIPAGIALDKNGASRSATTSFLISTPQTGVDSILVTYSLLGLPFAVIRPIAAFVTGIFGGVLASGVDKHSDHPAAAPVNAAQAAEGGMPKRSVREFMNFVFVDFFGDIAGSLVIGLGVAAAIALAVPEDFFMSSFSSPFLQMGIMLIASIPMYVCATASVPVAAVLLAKGISPGAALVFLMAGPATNAATIAVIRNSLGSRSFYIYLFSIVTGALLFGALINFLPPQIFLPPLGDHAHQHQLLPPWLTDSAALILALALAYHYFSKLRSRLSDRNKRNTHMAFTVLDVHGMTCRHCKMNVENKLNSLPFVTQAEANPDTNRVHVEGEGLDMKLIESSIRELGYDFRGVLPSE